MVTTLTLRTKERSMKYKMARYDIRNVSMKDLVNKIIKFEKFVKVPHFKKELKHEPTLSYLHLVECLQKCIMRSDDHELGTKIGERRTQLMGRKSLQVRSKICLNL